MRNWKPVSGNIMTRWAKNVSPENAWPEYPRPQMRRLEWLNLNGLWKYGIVSNQQETPPSFYEEILVPFAMESALSGVGRALQPYDRLFYKRMFSIPDDWHGKRILLHFGAVDWEATIFLNGNKIGNHRGGYLPFWFDITSHIVAGENELMVVVWDPSDAFWQQHGKQALKPKNIWYTAVSGIWQTVWLEPIPESFITGLKITPDVDAEKVHIQLDINQTSAIVKNQAKVNIQIKELENPVIQVELEPGKTEVEIQISNPKLWSPDSPYLYDLIVEAGEDRVESYFAMRKFSIGFDKQGITRLCLNNQPFFQYGTLDQGYWPDGLYTPPTDEAMYWDLKLIKSLGFNMLRKHVKVEPARFYHYCDKLGLIVWQDMVNGGAPLGQIASFMVNIFGSRREDRNYRYAGRSEPASRHDYHRELQELVDHLYNFPCIGMWVPFNEGWGQFDARSVAEWLTNYDPTRLVDHASGWFDQGGGDCKS